MAIKGYDEWKTTPPDYKRKKICNCDGDGCGEEIFVGDNYWEINGFVFCEDCGERECRSQFFKEGEF